MKKKKKNRHWTKTEKHWGDDTLSDRIPPTSSAKVVPSGTTFANRDSRYRTKLGIVNLERAFIPGEDLLLVAGGLILSNTYIKWQAKEQKNTTVSCKQRFLCENTFTQETHRAYMQCVQTVYLVHHTLLYQVYIYISWLILPGCMALTLACCIHEFMYMMLQLVPRLKRARVKSTRGLNSAILATLKAIYCLLQNKSACFGLSRGALTSGYPLLYDMVVCVTTNSRLDVWQELMWDNNNNNMIRYALLRCFVVLCAQRMAWHGDERQFSSAVGSRSHKETLKPTVSRLLQRP